MSTPTQQNPAFSEFEPDLNRPNQRATDPTMDLIAHKVTRIAADVRDLAANYAAMHSKIDVGLQEQREALDTVLSEAFPEADPIGHRKHHEAVIKAAEDRAAFWKTMYTELAKWGLIGFIGWAAVSIWNSFLQGPHK